MESYRKFFHQYFLLYRPFISDLNRLLNEYDLHYSQWSIMYYLEMYESVTLVELSKHLYVEKPTITRTVNSLIKLQYVEQIKGRDNREKRIQLSPRGKEITAILRKNIDEYEQDIMTGISPEKQAEVIEVMDQIRSMIIKRGV
ncbi:MarR family winged helix-turn-helix transcriptional regulator [Cytobacillus gottheilii]|uniref:MarR family transcriptional regulator n=1 Tax=Cytobacillus gottheilii TaxID=859144 RepID=A0ABX8FC10_9BACI|nr:MarR family transcriptional regulator [Cytobacillus gottheilii]QVY61831.1 MarR family transcriptional regulator [Cytobacillus gottheilii]